MGSKGIASTFARFALGLLLGSAAVEGSLRLIEATPLWRILPLPDAALYGPDVDTGYAHRPGARGIRTPENRALVEINSLDLRDRLDRTREKPPGALRWAIAGDSIIEAQQVPFELTFTYLAEERLTRDAGRRIEVVNLGLAGARPAVIVERLRSRAPALDLDGLIVMVNAGEFLNPQPDDPSEYAGYVPSPDGKVIISKAFRDGRGYRMRQGPVGRAIYWAIDHSRLAVLLINRKNAGLWAELAQAATGGTRQTEPCSTSRISEFEALWGPNPPGFSGARLEAFLGDLATINSQRQIPMIVAFRGLRNECSAFQSRFDALGATISHLLARDGIGYADLDKAVRRRMPPATTMGHIYGFGAKLGSGHLNEFGHRIYMDVVVQIISDSGVNAARRTLQPAPHPNEQSRD